MIDRSKQTKTHDGPKCQHGQLNVLVRCRMDKSVQNSDKSVRNVPNRQKMSVTRQRNVLTQSKSNDTARTSDSSPGKNPSVQGQSPNVYRDNNKTKDRAEKKTRENSSLDAKRTPVPPARGPSRAYARSTPSKTPIAANKVKTPSISQLSTTTSTAKTVDKRGDKLPNGSKGP